MDVLKHQLKKVTGCGVSVYISIIYPQTPSLFHFFIFSIVVTSPSFRFFQYSLCFFMENPLHFPCFHCHEKLLRFAPQRYPQISACNFPRVFACVALNTVQRCTLQFPRGSRFHENSTKRMCKSKIHELSDLPHWTMHTGKINAKTCRHAKRPKIRFAPSGKTGCPTTLPRSTCARIFSTYPRAKFLILKREMENENR